MEVPAKRPDPRASDPQATQKISREQLEQALRRTKSGTRRAMRSEPELEGDLTGPRDDAPAHERTPDDDAPQITIVRIDSMGLGELEPVDPLSLPPIQSSPVAIPRPASRPEVHPRPATHGSVWTRRIELSPRLAFTAGIVVTVLVLLAAFFGFFAGRVLPGSK